MRIFLLITAALAFAIVSPLPILDRWEANFRAEMRASVHDYLPKTAQSAERRALLRDICALPDSGYQMEM